MKTKKPKEKKAKGGTPENVVEMKPGEAGEGDPDEATRLKQLDALEDAGPGVGKQKIPQVEKAAVEYKTIRDKRMAMTKKETAAKAVLMAAMKDHKVAKYYFEDQEVEYSSTENVKIATINPADAGRDTGSDGGDHA